MSLPSLRQQLAQDRQLVISVRVRANAKISAITNLLSDGSLKISLSAPAVDGKANQALLKLLAQEFSVPLDNISILSGQTNRLKLIKISSV